MNLEKYEIVLRQMDLYDECLRRKSNYNENYRELTLYEFTRIYFIGVSYVIQPDWSEFLFKGFEIH